MEKRRWPIVATPRGSADCDSAGLEVRRYLSPPPPVRRHLRTIQNASDQNQDLSILTQVSYKFVADCDQSEAKEERIPVDWRGFWAPSWFR